MKITSCIAPQSNRITNGAGHYLRLILPALSCFCALLLSNAEEVTSCVKLSPETADGSAFELKFGEYEFQQTDPPRWQVYRINEYRVDYDFLNSVEFYESEWPDGWCGGVGYMQYHQLLTWNEHADYREVYHTDYTSETSRIDGTQSSLYHIWGEDHCNGAWEPVNRELREGDPYNIDAPDLQYFTYYPPGLQATADSATSLTTTGETNHTYESYSRNWDYTRTEQLSDLYTTEQLISLAKSNLPTNLPEGGWFLESSYEPTTWVASRFLSEDETQIELVRGAYRMQFEGEEGVEYELKWTERFVPAEPPSYSATGPVSETTVTETIVATGKPQYTKIHYVEPPEANGYIVVVPPKVLCEECSAGSDTSENGSVDFSINLGRSREGASAGKIFIAERVPTNTLATLQALQFDVSPDVSFHYDLTTYQIRQIVAPETVVDITVLSDHAYEIRFYHPADFADLNAGPTGDPFAAWRIENPDATGATFNQLNIIKTADGNTLTNAYVWSNSDQGWTLLTANGLRKESKSKSVDPETGDEVETVTIRNQQDLTVYVESRRYHTYDDPLGRALLELKIDPQGAAKTTTYQYFDDPVLHGTNYGRIKQVVRDTGAWTRYEYNSSGRLTKEISSFTNAAVNAPEASCRVIEYDYSPVAAGDDGTLDPTTPRTVVEKVLGQAISKRCYAALTGERRQIQCIAPDAEADNTNNLVTITKTYTEGDQRVWGKTRLVDYPDGTREVRFYDFLDDPSGTSYVTNTVVRGEADPNGENNVVNGTRTVSLTTDTGRSISTMAFDIASEVLTSSETYSDFDAFGRPQRVTFLDGTHTDTSYSCCGVDTVVNRDGGAVSYEYDALKRRWAEHRLVSPTDSISLLSSYDPQGNVVSTARIGTNGSSITLSTNVYDASGQLISTTDALNHTTRYTNYVDGAGQTIKKTTYEDGSTRIETYFKDGSLQSLTGSAVHPIRYEYGVETSGADAGKYFVKEIKLKSDGTDSDEWTKSYRDALGRACKTLYADAAFSQSVYNQKGQLEKQVDPDGVTMLYQYNRKAEREYVAVDMNPNGLIDLDGIDRVTRTIATVGQASSLPEINVRRIETYVWTIDNSASSNLVSTVETSVDGLHTWSRVWNNGTAVTSETQTAFDPAASLRVVTQTAPDGSYTVSTNQFGRLISLTRSDALNNPLSAISYSYDAHGRPRIASDARTGATTFEYDELDRVTSVTSPIPGPGQNAQTTVNFFDNMGRIWKTLLPDNTSVTNEFFTTGQLRRTSGSRTYPVEYTYDAQGRMKTMKTWQNFADNTGAAVTTWNYDGMRGFLTNKVYADDSPGPSYSYKPSGRLQTRTWARGITTTYGYNNAGDLETVDYSDATPDVTYVYERLGRQQTVTQGSNVCNYAYTDSGQLLSEDATAGILNGLRLTNGYDALLHRTNLFAQYSTTPLLHHSYAFDAASRLQNVSDGTNSATYSYLANSRFVENIVFQQNGATRMTTTKAYDNLNRLTSIQSSAGGSPVAWSAYAYNSANQRTGMTNADNARWVYTYDSLGQVTAGKKYWADGTPVAGQQLEYGFDDIGNRTSSKAGGDQSGAGLRPASYASSLLNQHTSRTVPGAVDILGSATNTSTVTVNNLSTYRKGDYFRDELSVDNASASVWLSVTNLAVLNDGSNPDIIATNTGNAFVPKTPETFVYDADGNMTNDGR